MPALVDPQPASSEAPPRDLDVTELPPGSASEPEPARLRWKLPLALYVATLFSTFFVVASTAGFARLENVAELVTGSQALAALPEALRLGFGDGLIYAAGLMTILTAHELGHYFQARRYGVPASLPYFIPLPLPPFGTMGAVIAMRAGTAKTRALFDLAITGPLAGLLPALTFSYIGLRLSTIEPFEGGTGSLGVPLIFELMASWAVETPAEDQSIVLHPLGYAGWVGIFITALNLLPIGQLDGGHILYTLAPGKAYAVSAAVIGTAIAAIVIDGFLGWTWGVWPWSFMITILLLFVGLKHPPAADHRVPLDRRRQIIGWLTLLFVLVGFTPTPFPH